ncbi:MAG TPA: hypothetical protein VIC85_03365 [Ktedonobacterales bacterium]|jgi:hypothetical protein
MRRCVCGASIRYGSVRCYQCGRIIPAEPEAAPPSEPETMTASVGLAANSERSGVGFANVPGGTGMAATHPATVTLDGGAATDAEGVVDGTAATATCQLCGAPLATDAAFCHRCGAPRMIGGASPFWAGRQAVPYRQALARGVTRAALKRKSPRLAGFLEFLLAGVGLIYAGAVWQGIAVLIGTLLVAALASSLTTDAANTELLLGGFVWAVVRIFLAVNAARAHNARLEDDSPHQ